MKTREFVKKNYKHFNSAALAAASDAWLDLLNSGGKMLVSLAGAMSTAELGISLSEMIRQDKVHAISCTGANLEEDIFNYVAHKHYKKVPGYRYLTNLDEKALMEKGFNRVTDTCIPEEVAFRRVERDMIKLWQKAERENRRYFPHEFMFQLLDIPGLHCEIDPKNSWLLAAKEKNIPIVTPGWEDSTLGNVFTSHVVTGDLKDHSIVKPGTEAMAYLIDWYKLASSTAKIGFFQIGGGIAGDFPICVVPLLRQDLKIDVPLWSYFCQISDSTTSFGSYSGAVPNEKITWGKLEVDTPSFIIESDATIAAPLIFSYVLDQ